MDKYAQAFNAGYSNRINEFRKYAQYRRRFARNKKEPEPLKPKEYIPERDWSDNVPMGPIPYTVFENDPMFVKFRNNIAKAERERLERHNRNYSDFEPKLPRTMYTLDFIMPKTKLEGMRNFYNANHDAYINSRGIFANYESNINTASEIDPKARNIAGVSWPDWKGNRPTERESNAQIRAIRLMQLRHNYDMYRQYHTPGEAFKHLQDNASPIFTPSLLPYPNLVPTLDELRALEWMIDQGFWSADTQKQPANSNIG